MKEQIYTIPVNEAFENDCECPLCFLHKKLENEAVDYTLGPAMMEPDYRILSNEKGFCQKHYKMLFEKQNKLSLALVLDTHLEETRKKIQNLSKNISSLKNDKKGLFKNSSKKLEDINCLIKNSTDSCVIFDKIDKTIERYIEVFFYLLENDEDFIEKVKSSKGFCIPHFNVLINTSFKYLSHKKAYEFVTLIYEKELSELERIQKDIHKFTLKFDYRNKDMEWGSAIDAPIRTIEKLTGHILNEEDKNDDE